MYYFGGFFPTTTKKRNSTYKKLTFFGDARPVFKMTYLTTKILVKKKVFLKTGQELTLETVEINW